MAGCFTPKWQSSSFFAHGKRVLAAGKTLLMVGMLSACSTLGLSSDEEGIPQGLHADSAGEYAKPVERNVTPTSPLRRTPKAVETNAAEPPAAEPAPQAAVQPVAPTMAAPQAKPQAAPQAAAAKSDIFANLPKVALPSAPRAQAETLAAKPLTPKPEPVKAEPLAVTSASATQDGQEFKGSTLTARDEGPSAPPASVNMTPPPPADVPAPGAASSAPQAPRPAAKSPLQNQYERRLAESGSGVSPASSFVDPGDEPIHLVPPTKDKTAQAASTASHPAGSFHVANVEFDGQALTQTDRASLREVARLYKETGGVVRVIGYDSNAEDRANLIARELVKLGVPAAKLMIGTLPQPAMVGAEIHMDI